MGQPVFIIVILWIYIYIDITICKCHVSLRVTQLSHGELWLDDDALAELQLVLQFFCKLFCIHILAARRRDRFIIKDHRGEEREEGGVVLKYQ